MLNITKLESLILHPWAFDSPRGPFYFKRFLCKLIREFFVFGFWLFTDVGMIMMQTGMVKHGLNCAYKNYLEGRRPFLIPCFAASYILFPQITAGNPKFGISCG